MEKITQPVSSDSAPVPVSRSLEKNIVYFKEKLGSSFDIMYKQTQIGGNKAMFIMDDGMCDNLLVTGQVVNPILTARDLPENAEERERAIQYIKNQPNVTMEEVHDYHG